MRNCTLLHTIALEPARWTERRVSICLAEIAERLVAYGFKYLEVFEPHLTGASDHLAIKCACRHFGLEMVVLSSYLDLSPLSSDEPTFKSALSDLEGLVESFQFDKVRLFPGHAVSPYDEAAFKELCYRVKIIAARMTRTEILLESHEDTIADSPQRLVDAIEAIARPNVGILFQPTRFNWDETLSQYNLQKKYIRHMHLQNRSPKGGFSLLADGVVDWGKLLRGVSCQTSLEFVPAGICLEEKFCIDEVLAQARSEMLVIQELYR